MEFEISHTTQYQYGHPAAEAYGEARLTPPNLGSQTVLSHRLTLDPEVATSRYTDHFGNQVDFFSLPFRHRRLVISNVAVVRTHPVSLPAESLEMSIGEARQIFNSLLPDVFDYVEPTSVVEVGREALQWAKRHLRLDRPLGASVQRLCEAIHDEFKYRSGSTENATALATIWKTKTGVCQDFAHIALSVLRTAGLPARYVCGYIDAGLTGAIATHAWVEVLLPGMVWAAIDPTNRKWCDDRYITVSYGRDYRDATPLRGTFKGSGGQVMRARVIVKRRREGARQAPRAERLATLSHEQKL
jgi:transglutaminase-like putative cysteine protease